MGHGIGIKRCSDKESRLTRARREVAKAEHSAFELSEREATGEPVQRREEIPWFDEESTEAQVRELFNEARGRSGSSSGWISLGEDQSANRFRQTLAITTDNHSARIIVAEPEPESIRALTTPCTLWRSFAPA